MFGTILTIARELGERVHHGVGVAAAAVCSESCRSIQNIIDDNVPSDRLDEFRPDTVADCQGPANSSVRMFSVLTLAPLSRVSIAATMAGGPAR